MRPTLGFKQTIAIADKTRKMRFNVNLACFLTFSEKDTYLFPNRPNPSKAMVTKEMLNWVQENLEPRSSRGRDGRKLGRNCFGEVRSTEVNGITGPLNVQSDSDKNQ